MLDLVMPWPPKELSPNARVHWAQLALVKKATRHSWAWQARQQGAVRMADAHGLRVALTFCAPTRRAYDMDNALARAKAGLDGLADVLGVDDSRWQYVIERGTPVKGGAVRVVVCRA